MLYLIEKDLLFIHNAKCAGMYVSSILESYMNERDIHIGGTKQGEAQQADYVQNIGINKHSSLELFNKRFDYLTEKTTVFATVRHPIDRVVSGFRYLKGCQKESWNFWFIDSIYYMNLFEFIESEFLCWIGSQYGNMTLNGELRAKPCYVNNLYHDLKFLSDKFGIVVPNNKVNMSRYGDAGIMTEELLQSKKHINIIQDRYREDYDNFEFQFAY